MTGGENKNQTIYRRHIRIAPKNKFVVNVRKKVPQSFSNFYNKRGGGFEPMVIV